MRRLKPTTRSWLIFAGIIVLIFSLSLLKFRFRMLMGKAGIFVAIIGLLLILLGKLKPKKRDAEKQ